MTVFKSLCFGVVIGVFFSCNISFAQEEMSADDLYEKAVQYERQKDYKNAMQWYLKAVDKGNIDAVIAVAILYECGLGINQDYQKAMQWYLKAADKGDAVAINNIGYLYEQGVPGVKQDYRQAMQWYLKAVDKGSTQAMFNIAVLYQNGLGVKKDLNKAATWYQRVEEAQSKQ